MADEGMAADGLVPAPRKGSMVHGGLTSRLQMDESARRARLGFLELGPEESGLLAELGDILFEHHEQLIDRWYEFLLARPETRDLLDRGRVKTHLKGAQARYFRELLFGPYDQKYFEDRLSIGFIHEKVGLGPAWYMGAYRKYLDLVRAFLRESRFEEGRILNWMRVLEKVVYLDMELALDAYFDTFHRELLDANATLRRMADQLEGRNQELSRQFERAQEAARVKEELLSRVSHELRTPLNAVIGYSDLLLDGIEGALGDEQRESIGTIRRQGGVLLGMIDRMIDTAKMAAAGNLTPKLFDAAAVIRRLSESAREAAAAKGLQFDVVLEGGLPRVLGDEAAFQLALGHVVENAFKFTRAGRVRLEARAEGNAVRFTIADTGPGIPAQHLDRIFEPFHQVDVGDTRAVTGLGIGLPLAKSALDRMGGSLRLVSSGPEGSVFELELPAEERASIPF